MGVYAKRCLRRHSIEFKELKIEVKAEVSESTPSRLVNIEVRVYTDAQLGGKKETL